MGPTQAPRASDASSPTYPVPRNCAQGCTRTPPSWTLQENKDDSTNLGKILLARTAARREQTMQKMPGMPANEKESRRTTPTYSPANSGDSISKNCHGHGGATANHQRRISIHPHRGRLWNEVPRGFPSEIDYGRGCGGMPGPNVQQNRIPPRNPDRSG